MMLMMHSSAPPFFALPHQTLSSSRLCPYATIPAPLILTSFAYRLAFVTSKKHIKYVYIYIYTVYIYIYIYIKETCSEIVKMNIARKGYISQDFGSPLIDQQ